MSRVLRHLSTITYRISGLAVPCLKSCWWPSLSGLALCLLMCFATGEARAAGGNDVALSERVDRIFANWSKPESPGLSVAVVREDQVVHLRGYGLASLEFNVPNAPSTVFHVASLSKQFTAFAIHLLAQDGQLSLDDEVRKFVPELRVEGPPITIRHLLHHTSGLRDQLNLLALAGLRLDDVITESAVLSLLWQQRQLNFEPGTEVLYSNSGYTLLALIVRRVSGQTLDEFAQRRIFRPLGMKSTHFHDDYGVPVKGRAYSYRRMRDGWRYVALSYSTVGPTSLFTTVEDLALWDANFAEAKVGGAAVAALQMPGRLADGKETTVASGLMRGRYRGLDVVEHSGSDAGYRAHYLRFPGGRLSVVLLGNAADIDSAGLARRVADVYLEGLPGVQALPTRAAPMEVPVRTSDLAPLVGHFEMRPGFVLHFTAEGSQFFAQATGQPRFELFPAAADRFFTKAFESSVRFDPPGTVGTVETATWTQNDRDQPLRRIVAESQPMADTAKACEGLYYSDELRTLYRLALDGGKLKLTYPRGELALTPAGENRFSASFPVGLVTLERNAKGLCNGLAVSNGRVRNLKFQRVNLVPRAE
jgi:CubicO group peptidase (beta-lactamase class C family)